METDGTAVGRATPRKKYDTESIWYRNFPAFSQLTGVLVFPTNWPVTTKKEWMAQVLAGGFDGVCTHLIVSKDKGSGAYPAVCGRYLEDGSREDYDWEKAYLIARMFANPAVAGNDRGPGNPDGDLRITVNGAVTALQKYLSLTASEKEAAVQDNVAAFNERLE